MFGLSERLYGDELSIRYGINNMNMREWIEDGENGGKSK
jgi:hypothetical protein